nr:hypothetical protein [Salicibibacter cibi]
MGWLNVVSLVLGLMAWILPMVNLFRYTKRNHLVKIEDWSALSEIGAVVLVGSVLLVVTIILNIVTLIVYRDRTSILISLFSKWILLFTILVRYF